MFLLGHIIERCLDGISDQDLDFFLNRRTYFFENKVVLNLVQDDVHQHLLKNWFLNRLNLFEFYMSISLFSGSARWILTGL